MKEVFFLQLTYNEALAALGGSPVMDKKVTSCSFTTGRHLSQASVFVSGRNIQIIQIKQYTKYSNQNDISFQQIYKYSASEKIDI